MRFGGALAWPAHEQGICALAWSPDGDRLASGGNDGAVLLWHPAGGRLGAAPERHRGSVRSIDWAPDGRRLIAGAEDAQAVVWDTRDWTVLARHADHRRWVNAVAWAPDGRRYASGSGDGTLLVYDAGDHRLDRRLVSLQGAVLSCCWSPDSSLLAAATWGGVVGIWRTADWMLHRRLRLVGAAWSVAWTPDGARLSSGGDDGRVLLWDVGTGQLVWAGEVHGDTVARVTVGVGGSVLASLSHDESIGLWRLSDGSLLDRLTGTYPGWVSCLAFHPGRPLLAGTDRSGRWITRWEVEPGEAAGSGVRSPSSAVAYARERVRSERAKGGWAIDLGALAAEVGRRGDGFGDPARIVRTAVLWDQARGELILSGDGRSAYLQAGAVGRAADQLTAAAGAAPGRDGVVPLSRVPGEILPGVQPEEGRLAFAHHVVRSELGWLQPAGGEPALCLPAAARGRVPVELAAATAVGVRWRVAGAPWGAAPFVRLVNTTLFRRFCLFDGALCVEDDRGRVAVMAWPRGSSELSLLLHPRDELAVLVELVDAILDDLGLRPVRLAAARAPTTPFRPARLAWRPWDAGAPDMWPLSLTDSPGTPATSLLEQARDELARQLRLLARGGRASSAVHDVMLCQVAADLGSAGQIRGALGDFGLGAWIDEERLLEQSPPEPALLDLAERVGVIAVLVGRAADRPWHELPIYPFYRALTEGRPAGSRRLRWLPIVLPEAPESPRLPDFLHSFDWIPWRDDPPAGRRESLVHVVAAVTRDRARL